MKTKILLAAVLAMGCIVSVPAAGAAGKAKAPAYTEVRDQVDAIKMGMIDLEANYWAWRVKYSKNTTYEQLLHNSKRWIGKAETKDRLMARIKEILDSGSARALTESEKKKYQDGKKKIRAILSPGSQDRKLIAELSMDYCVDLEARYWGRRVAGGETVILEKMHNWSLRPELKKKLLLAIEEKSKQEVPALSREELYKLDACTEKTKR